MRIEVAQQRTDRPVGFPDVKEPVNATLEIPIYYVSSDVKPPSRWDHPCFVARVFAETVLAALEISLETHGYGLAHVGIYNPRYARHADGTDIIPRRVSNHGLGMAIDFKGIVDRGGHYTPYSKMTPAMVKELVVAPVEAAIAKAKRKSEIKPEGGWLHIGIWP